MNKGCLWPTISNWFPDFQASAGPKRIRRLKKRDICGNMLYYLHTLRSSKSFTEAAIPVSMDYNRASLKQGGRLVPAPAVKCIHEYFEGFAHIENIVGSIPARQIFDYLLVSDHAAGCSLFMEARVVRFEQKWRVNQRLRSPDLIKKRWSYGVKTNIALQWEDVYGL